jgi:hypothetical protein
VRQHCQSAAGPIKRKRTRNRCPFVPRRDACSPDFATSDRKSADRADRRITRFGPCTMVFSSAAECRAHVSAGTNSAVLTRHPSRFQRVVIRTGRHVRDRSYLWAGARFARDQVGSSVDAQEGQRRFGQADDRAPAIGSRRHSGRCLHGAHDYGRLADAWAIRSADSRPGIRLSGSDSCLPGPGTCRIRQRECRRPAAAIHGACEIAFANRYRTGGTNAAEPRTHRHDGAPSGSGTEAGDGSQHRLTRVFFSDSSPHCARQKLHECRHAG